MVEYRYKVRENLPDERRYKTMVTYHINPEAVNFCISLEREEATTYRHSTAWVEFSNEKDFRTYLSNIDEVLTIETEYRFEQITELYIETTIGKIYIGYILKA